MKTNPVSQTAIALTVVSLTASLALASPPEQDDKKPGSVKPLKSPGKAAAQPQSTITPQERNRLLNRLLEIREDAKISQAAASETRAERLKIERTLRAYFEQRRNARKMAAGGKGELKPSVIGHITTRKVRVTIRNGAKGAVYELRTPDGKTILAAELTPDQLQAYDPKLHKLVDQAMAGRKSPDGSFIDARRYVPALPTTAPSPISITTPPAR